MKRDAAVLDRNLELLLRRAYVPALPLPEFRAGLERTFMEQLAARGARGEAIVRSVHPVRPRRPLLLPLAAAAALVLLTWVGWRTLGTGPPGLDALLESGQVAVRTDPAGAWRARGSSGALAFEGNYLALATPPGGADAAAELLTAEARIAVGADARVLLEGTAAAPRVTLARGGLALEHGAAEPPLALGSSHGTIAVGAARLEAVLEADALAVTLGSGDAWVDGATERQHLVPGSLARIVGGRLLLDPGQPSGVEHEPAPGGRHALDVEAADAEPGRTSPRPAGPRQARIEGAVRTQDGAPVERFRVGLLRARRGNELHPPRMRAYEDPAGAFIWEDVPADTYEVIVEADGFSLARSGAVVLGAGEARSVALELVPGGTVRGHVIDARTGNPLFGALVLSEQDAPTHGLPFSEEDLDGLWLPVSTRTRHDGSFELVNLSPGRHTLRVSAAGLGPAWTTALTVDPERPVEGVMVELRAAGTLTGKVTREGGSPHVGAFLIVSAMENEGRPQMNFGRTVTDADGRYEVRDLPGGVMLAILIGDPTTPQPPRVLPVSIVQGEASVLDFGREGTGTRLFGVLRDADGKALGGQNLGLFEKRLDQIEFEDDWKASTSLMDGSYAFEGLAPATYLLYAVGDMGRTLSWVGEVEVPAWPELEYDMTFSPNRIAGTVSDAQTDAPVPRAVMILEHIDPATGRPIFAGLAMADGEGRYALESVPPGRYHVTAYPTEGLLGFGSEEVVVHPGEAETTVALGLGLGSVVRVRVVDGDDRPVTGAWVQFEGDDDRTFTFDQYPLTDDRGLHIARGVRPGTYRAMVLMDGEVRASAEVVCRAGLESEVRLVLPSPSGDEREETTAGEDAGER